MDDTPQICTKCGATHGMGIRVTVDSSWEPIDLCRGCLFGEFKSAPDPHITIEE